MSKITKFYLGLIPATLLVIVAEATLPSLIANYAVWLLDSDTMVNGLLYFIFWVATFAAVLVTSVIALTEIHRELCVQPRVDGIMPVVPIRRG